MGMDIGLRMRRASTSAQPLIRFAVCSVEHQAARMIPDTHLDLGCGTRPRNPYGRSQLFGVDLRSLPSTADCEFRSANLVMEPLPFGDNMFGSISAFDFLEHVPRVLPTADGSGTRFPFVELMNEIWRALAPNGLFYAVTPTYPSPAAFHDPTHVNLIGTETHQYFCEPALDGRIYGFHGHFKVRRAEWVLFENTVNVRQRPTLQQSWRRLRWRAIGRMTHFLWELEAIKPR